MIHRDAKMFVLRSVIAIAAVIFVFVSAAGEFRRFAVTAPDLAHTALSSPPNIASATNGDPEHLHWSFSPLHHENSALAMLSLRAPTVAGAAVMAAHETLQVSTPRVHLEFGRGPPSASASVLAGRQLLTRLCLARR